MEICSQEIKIDILKWRQVYSAETTSESENSLSYKKQHCLAQNLVLIDYLVVSSIVPVQFLYHIRVLLHHYYISLDQQPYRD